MSTGDDKSQRPRKPPTPLAVALEYRPEGPDAPSVVASGRGAVAEQILAIAFAHGVKVREDADLAEILSLIELESEIPLEAFAAVAEILAYVYRANGEAPPLPSLAQQPPASPPAPGKPR